MLSYSELPSNKVWDTSDPNCSADQADQLFFRVWSTPQIGQHAFLRFFQKGMLCRQALQLRADFWGLLLLGTRPQVPARFTNSNSYATIWCSLLWLRNAKESRSCRTCSNTVGHSTSTPRRVPVSGHIGVRFLLPPLSLIGLPQLGTPVRGNVS